MNKKISVVMAYHNRLSLLQRTLGSIKLSKYQKDTKIIIVDDASDPSHDARLVDTLGLNVQIITITKKEKTWINSCIVYNKGFEQVEGDLVIIQNPECLHCGDVISHAIENTSDSDYLVYSCWKLREKLDSSYKEPKELRGQWCCHSSLGEGRAFHFLSAISRKNLNRLGGFDERYAEGYCFEDNEFLVRVKRMGLNVRIVPEDEVYSAHQLHSKERGSRQQWLVNNRLFHNKTKKESGYIANE